MAINFPNSPGIGSVFTDSTSGFSYEWDGTVWKSYAAASSSRISIIDDISGSFDGIGQTFALTSSSVALSPSNSASLLINLGGVIQDPSDDYSISGSNIVFSTAPTSGLTFSGIQYGPAIPVTVVTIPDGTATDGDFTVSGTLNVGTAVTVNSTGANVTGVITATSLNVGTVNSTGANVTGVITATSLNVGTAVTVNSTGANVTGVITATSFEGDGSGLTGAGSTVADDTTTDETFYPIFTQSTSGTVTATKVSTTKLFFNPSSGILSATGYYGDGSGLTGVSAGSTVADDTTTNETFYPIFTQTTSGVIEASKISTTKFTFNPSTGEASATNFNSTSDESLKTNIHTVENSLDIVDQLRGVSFDWKENGKSSYGVIAQELEQVLPELVAQTDPKSVNYNGIIGILIEAIKELREEIREFKSTK